MTDNLYPNLAPDERQAGAPELRRLLDEAREKFVEALHGLAAAEAEAKTKKK